MTQAGRMTSGGFFAFQVADASAVSARSPGKDTLAVDIWVAAAARRGLSVCLPHECVWILTSEAENQTVCLEGGAEVLRLPGRLDG